MNSLARRNASGSNASGSSVRRDHSCRDGNRAAEPFGFRKRLA